MSISINGTSGLVFNDASTQNTAATGFGFKNRIINGAMQTWQRGTSGFTTNPNFASDRWLVGASTSLSAVAQSTDVPTGFKYSLSIAGTNFPNAIQRIEAANCSDLANQTVTISFWLKQSSGAGSNSIGLVLYYANSSDTFSSTTQIGSTSLITATASWAQYTATFSSISANSVNGLQVQIYANTASAATFLITGVQLEKGSTATSFDYRPYGTEFALCQRYYYRISAAGGQYTHFGSGYINSVSSAQVLTVFPVTMRVPPTAVEQSGTATHYGVLNLNTSTISNVVPSFSYADSWSARTAFNTASTLTAGQGSVGRAESTSAYLGWSAEL